MTLVFALATVLLGGFFFYIVTEPGRFEEKVTRSLESYLVATLRRTGCFTGHTPFRLVPAGTLISKLRSGHAGWLAAGSFVANAGGSKGCVFAHRDECTVGGWQPGSAAVLVYCSADAKLYAMLFVADGESTAWPQNTVGYVRDSHYPFVVLPLARVDAVDFANSMIS